MVVNNCAVWYFWVHSFFRINIFSLTYFNYLRSYKKWVLLLLLNKENKIIQMNVYNVHLIRGYIFIDDILNEQKWIPQATIHLSTAQLKQSTPLPSFWDADLLPLFWAVWAMSSANSSVNDLASRLCSSHHITLHINYTCVFVCDCETERETHSIQRQWTYGPARNTQHVCSERLLKYSSLSFPWWTLFTLN